MEHSLPAVQHRDDVVRIPDAYSQYENFKYRLWFIWYIWSIAQLRQGSETPPPWSAIVCGADANGDLWFWEDADEKCIKEFAEDLADLAKMPVGYWDDACRAVKARCRSHPDMASAGPLAHLTPHNRLHFIAWLIVAGPVRKAQISRRGDFRNLEICIQRWGACMSFHGDSYAGASSCRICGVSHFLSTWVETMLKVYLLDDLRAIPWYHACGCWERHLYDVSHSEQRGTAQQSLKKDSAALRVLYELVVSPWPLILWVNFRMVVNDRPDQLQMFLDILRGPDENLFARAGDDDSDLYQILVKADGCLGLYPCDWSQFMVEIDLKTWLQISNMTWTGSRPGPGLYDDMKIRLVGGYSSSTLISAQNILAPLDIHFNHFPFASMARIRVADESYPIQAPLTNSESEEFWASANLESWLSVRSEALCHAVWNTSSRISVIERIKCMHLALNALPQNLAMYTHSLRLQQCDGRRALKRFWKFWNHTEWGFLDSLKRYSLDVQILLGLVKKSVAEGNSFNPAILMDINEHMNRDIFALVAKLVLLFRDPESYKAFLACRDDDAQRLLDLLQDLLDLESFSVAKPLICKALLRLSRASGLHPRCCTLPELQKVGEQVTGGGFGDLWQGLVRGQSVSVKVMRIFKDTQVETVLKEFSREALIWRQLCHPNVLPFFGVYYLESRLCLVSPWMTNGNMMDFLTNEDPPIPNRLALILDVALGLRYLHEQNVVHGDLKGINILVAPSRKACIADFGLSSIADVMTLRFTHSTSYVQGGTARYQAPELLRGESRHYGSDVYAFACVCYEILTGLIPFHEMPNDVAVILKVVEGKRPSQPVLCSETTTLGSLWKLIQDCWEEKADLRPTAPQIVDRLVGPSIGATITSSVADWDDTFTSKFRRSLHAQPLLPTVDQIEHILFGYDGGEGTYPGYFPVQRFSGAENVIGLSQLDRRLKRRYEEETSTWNPLNGNWNERQPTSKKQKPLSEIFSVQDQEERTSC